MAEGAKGFVIAAPHSGSGKTLITLGLCRALVERRLKIAPAKTGPDYIDPTFLTLAAKSPCTNFDPWAMSAETLKGLAHRHAQDADLLVCEGVMGLFDGSAAGGGSTADLAEALDLPVILVVDCSHMAQSVAAIVDGFANFRAGLRLAGVILNKVASDRHEAMLLSALAAANHTVLGVVRRTADMKVPERHLGLTLPGEVENVEAMISTAANAMSGIDLDALVKIAAPVGEAAPVGALRPLGQHIAIARDAAFAFVYEHLLTGWRAAGSTISFFSPLANEAPDAHADAIFLPGGYPELHGEGLSAAERFKAALVAARDRGALIYGECGGYMVLGEGLTDRDGKRHEMAGLLPVSSSIDRPRRQLGYRLLTQEDHLPWNGELKGHEFHYSSATPANLPPLFKATDVLGEAVPDMGAVLGRVMGSYAHVIGEA